MNRSIDKNYYTYTVHSCGKTGILVKCPKCQGLGIVREGKENIHFSCQNCGYQESRDRMIYRYDVHNQCENCGRYYRVDIEDKEKQHFPALHVACPYCGTRMSGKVQKTPKYELFSRDIENGCEPWFGLELWFLASFQGKLIWALNREHLAYLIDYLSANLREEPAELSMTKTQSDHLPTFMKTAKNRERIVKLLKELQKKS